jgi:lysozyme
MTAVDIALPRLQTEEGFRATAYQDTQGHTTIGYGFNVNAGISKTEAAALLVAQLQERDAMLQQLPWYAGLDPVRQSVCLDIAFNDGLSGLLGFPKMIEALAAGNWPEAAANCHVVEPQLATRYSALASILLTGTVGTPA